VPSILPGQDLTLVGSPRPRDRELLRAPDMSARLIAGILAELERAHGAAMVAEACAEAGLARESFFDLDGWVSNGFHHELVLGMQRRLTGRAEIPPWDAPFWQSWRRVGHQGYTRERLGPYWPLLRALGSPEPLFKRAPGLVQRFNRTLRLQVLSQSPGYSLLEIGPRDPKDAALQVPGNCWARIGILEGLGTVWGQRHLKVEHMACMYDPVAPAPACVYRVSYGFGRSDWRSVATAAITAGTLLVGGWAYFGMPAWALLAGGVGVVGAAAKHLSDRLRAIDEAIELEAALARSDARYARLFTESVTLRRTALANRKLSGYLPEELVDRILRDPEEELRLGGTRTLGAVLFTDVVNFTPRCEAEAPERVLSDLNLLFGALDEVIRRHGGVIDKRMGDGLMVVFPGREGEDEATIAQRAARCALELLRAMRGVNDALAERGAKPMELRAGIAAGPLVQGNMGSPMRMEYTVIGAPVNLAARLEPLAAPGHVVVEARLFEVPPPGATLASRRSVAVKGIRDEVALMELTYAP
jgi:class 3 adenylate cyclase